MLNNMKDPMEILTLALVTLLAQAPKISEKESAQKYVN